MKKRIPFLVCLLVVTLLAGVVGWIWWHDNRVVTSFSHALSNRCFINAAKEQWAMAHNAPSGTVVTVEQLREVDPRGPDICLSGGTISIGRIGEPATCSIHGSLENPKKEKTILFFKEMGY